MTEMEPFDVATARQYRCPECRADAGEPCTVTSGRITFHARRIDSALTAYRKAQVRFSRGR